ncbi:glycosyl hydrolase family 28-related protein [Phaeovulum sp.]|uniref:glycosyl hydrolase family 28-related protein n=1 Tax=Phaeovulum sp. TaxID=2934796 RepID=UPI0039E2F481
MNKAITDGLVLTPPAFEFGLDAWSSEDGTAGSNTYQGAANAALVTADQDFGSCLEMVKTSNTQKLRAMAETPILPGCYLRVTARLKAVSGNLPSVAIAGYAAQANGSHVNGLVEATAAVALTSYGKVVTISAIIGTGARGGVDMVWGRSPVYGHFGLNLTGPNGGVVRIDDIEIEDITDAFLRDMMDWVDVRDFGAVGDGVTDDRAAFAAADDAAAGRYILVSAGSFLIGASLTIAAPIRFEGSLVMPTAAKLLLLSSYDFPTYADAFGDEMAGFKKALQALFAYTDHNTLDLKGRRVEVSEPIDVRALAPDVAAFSNRRVIANGQFNVIGGPAWDTVVVTSQASYSTGQPTTLTAVANIANIAVGARVSGTGVGREVYVKAVNVGASSLTLSQPLYGGAGTRTFTFTRYKYILDFSGMAQLDRFHIENVEFLCNHTASCIMLAPEGQMFQLRDSYVTHPKDRAITSIGWGCQDLSIDGCQFLSSEMQVPAQDRTSIALNVNANDVKIRTNRFVRFGHTMVMGGSGHLIVGNHWFQGDDENNGVRVAGLVLAQTNVQSAVTGNYIDNSVIEWTNEYAPSPDYNNEYSFGGLTVTGNTFISLNSAPWFAWFSVKPYGAGHFIHGLNVSCNVFKAVNGVIDRPERVDTSFADLDYGRMRNILMEGNIFNGVAQVVSNPAFLQYDQSTAQNVWSIDLAAYLPFNGWARNVESVVAEGMISNTAGARVSEMPFVTVEQGSRSNQIQLNWSQMAKGRVHVRVRMDNPN